MKNPLILSCTQLFGSEGRALLFSVFLWGLLSFVVLWLGAAWLLRVLIPDIGGLGGVMYGWLSGAASLLLTILIFPALMSVTIGLFQERAAALVEKRFYPYLGNPRRSSLREQALAGIRLLGWILFVNTVVFPLYFIPGLNILVLVGVNGLVIGREYFEVAGIRWSAMQDVRQGRRKSRWKIWFSGSMIAGLYWIPGVNLFTPLLGVMMMTHLFHQVSHDVLNKSGGRLERP